MAAFTGSPADAGADGNIDPSDTRLCIAGSNGLADALNSMDGNAIRDLTGAKTQTEMDNTAALQRTAEDSPGKPQRAAILSRSWRQIFPRAN